MVILNISSSFDPKVCSNTSLNVNLGCQLTGQNVKREIAQQWNIPEDQLKLCQGKRYVSDTDPVKEDETVHVLLGLVGGKGGFGSMLRAIGAQIEKTTNKEACRDLSGRRLRDINEEKRLKKWIAKQAEREREKAERKRLRLERLMTPPTHEFHDPTYDRARSNLTENVHDAVSQGIQKAKQEVSTKRKAEETITKPLKKKSYRWMEDDDDSSDLDDEQQAEHSGENSDVERISSSETSSVHNEGDSSVDSFEPDKKTDHVSAVDGGQSSPDVRESSSAAATSESSSAAPSDNLCVANVEKSGDDLGVANVEKNDDGGDCNAEKNDPDQIGTAKMEENRSCKTAEYTMDDVGKFESVEQLEALGLDELKAALTSLGMKCGGSLSERAQRLFGVKGLKHEDIPGNLLMKKKKLN